MTNDAEDDGDKLVVRAKVDRASFGRLYDRYYPIVIRYVMRRLFVQAAAEDVVSEVFLHVAEHLPTFAGVTELEFRCWTYRIASNAVATALRSGRRRNELLELAVQSGRLSAATEATALDSESLAADWSEVASALMELDERSQAAVTLRYMESLKYEEIAKILSIRPATARVVVSRALDRLRALLARPHAATGGIT